MMATFDTLTATRDMEQASMDRKAAEAVAAAIRNGRSKLATKTDVVTLRWAVGLNLAVSLATLAAVLKLLPV